MNSSSVYNSVFLYASSNFLRFSKALTNVSAFNSKIKTLDAILLSSFIILARHIQSYKSSKLFISLYLVSLGSNNTILTLVVSISLQTKIPPDLVDDITPTNSSTNGESILIILSLKYSSGDNFLSAISNSIIYFRSSLLIIICASLVFI